MVCIFCSITFRFQNTKTKSTTHFGNFHFPKIMTWKIKTTFSIRNDNYRSIWCLASYVFFCLFCIEADFPLSISCSAFISISFLAHNIQKAVTIQSGQMLMRIVCIFKSFCSVKISMFVWNFYEKIAWLHGTISHIVSLK